MSRGMGEFIGKSPETVYFPSQDFWGVFHFLSLLLPFEVSKGFENAVLESRHLIVYPVGDDTFDGLSR